MLSISKMFYALVLLSLLFTIGSVESAPPTPTSPATTHHPCPQGIVGVVRLHNTQAWILIGIAMLGCTLAAVCRPRTVETLVLMGSKVLQHIWKKK